MPLYLLYASNQHPTFRIPELASLAKLAGLPITEAELQHDLSQPFLTIELPDDDDARRLVDRSLLIKGVFALLAEGQDHERMHQALKNHKDYPFPAYRHVSFKFIVDSFENKRSMEEQQAVIQDLAHLDWQGKIDLKNPDETFYILEHWLDSFVLNVPPVLQHVYFARIVKESTTARARGMIGTYDLKKREYLGTTSMDAELSLLTANQILAQEGDLVYDPFVGTGSFLVTASAFGATCIGSDIDGRQVRGATGLKQQRRKDPSWNASRNITYSQNDLRRNPELATADTDHQTVNIQSNYDQYGFPQLLLDCLIFDIKHPPWHTNLQLDGIATDCPYAIRAGAKTLGRDMSKQKTLKHYADQDRSQPAQIPDDQGGGFVHQRQGYLPPKRPYELDEMMADLLQTSFTLLKPGARLAVWLPILPEESEIPAIASPEGDNQVSRGLQRKALKAALRANARQLEREALQPAGQREAQRRNKLPPSLLNHDGMRLVSDSVQIFSRWSRRLLTFEKVQDSKS